jgi:hypothetical protein
MQEKSCEHCPDSEKRGYKYCRYCGNQVNKQYISKVVKYCPNCDELAASVKIPVPDGTYCPRCGKPTRKIIEPFDWADMVPVT